MKPLVLFDGLSRLAIGEDPDGRLRITVDDRDREGFTYTTASPVIRALIAESIQGDACPTPSAG